FRQVRARHEGLAPGPARRSEIRRQRWLGHGRHFAIVRRKLTYAIERAIGVIEYRFRRGPAGRFRRSGGRRLGAATLCRIRARTSRRTARGKRNSTGNDDNSKKQGASHWHGK